MRESYREFIMREKHRVTSKPKFHNGIDIKAPLGTLIKAAKTGVVQRSKAQIKDGKMIGYGYYVRLKHTRRRRKNNL